LRCQRRWLGDGGSPPPITPTSAQNSADSADAAVDAAQDALDSAEAKLDAVQDGPSAEDLDAAEAAVAAAEAQVASAQARLADLKDGADAGDIATAESAVTAAEASLESAEERLAEARRGPDANAIAQAQQAIRTAMLTLEAAQIRVKNAQIIAPFSGTVASVNITPGEFASAALQPAAIVMLTPDAMVLKIDVGETDYPTITIDQGGAALFDGIPGKIYPFRITEIGLAPTVTQGVVTFKVTATIAILEGNPRPAPGMNARGQLTVGSKPDVLVVRRAISAAAAASRWSMCAVIPAWRRSSSQPASPTTRTWRSSVGWKRETSSSCRPSRAELAPADPRPSLRSPAASGNTR
jgi:hypothetical protein